MTTSLGTVSQLLVAWRAGEDHAQDELFSLLYDDLHRIARDQRRRYQGGNTLDTTAMVHELYEKLRRKGLVDVENRLHFSRIVAKILRRILIDYARSQQRKKKGGDWVKVDPEAIDRLSPLLERQAEEILTIHHALTDLEQVDERLAEMVELHFFAGLTYDEIADQLGITKRTVTRDWAKAKTWLRRALRELETGRSSHPE